jgi:hypothetical protein
MGTPRVADVSRSANATILTSGANRGPGGLAGRVYLYKYRADDCDGTSLADAQAAVGNFAVFVNDNDAFFSSSYSTDKGRLKGNTTAARDFILLHEPGHSLGVLKADFADAAGKRNDNAINSNCAKRFNHH